MIKFTNQLTTYSRDLSCRNLKSLTASQRSATFSPNPSFYQNQVRLLSSNNKNSIDDNKVNGHQMKKNKKERYQMTFYQKIKEESGIINDFFSEMRGRHNIVKYNQKSALSNMNKGNKDMQSFVDQQHFKNQGKILIPYVLGEVYKSKFIDKWLNKRNLKTKKEEDSLETNQKDKGLEAAAKPGTEIIEENEEDDDTHFDDWQGVSREGDSKEDKKNDDENDNDDNNPGGGVMMPIPNAI